MENNILLKFSVDDYIISFVKFFAILFFLYCCYLVGYVILKVYDYFTKKEIVDIEGEIVEIIDDPFPIQQPSYIDGLPSNNYFYGPPLIGHEYSMKVLTPKGEMNVSLTAELFKKISDKLSHAEKHIRLHCEKILWINQIKAKAIVNN